MARKASDSRRHCQMFAQDVARWLVKNAFIVDALVGLRRMGDEGSDALAALLNIRRVEQFRLGWELCVALAEGNGSNPYLELTAVLGADRLSTVVEGLWGSPWDAPQDRRLRSV